MIPRTQRFHGRNSFRSVFKNGTTRRGRVLLMKFTPSPHRPTSRTAVVVSKKTLKSAVKRNRVRRRIFNIVRHELQSLTHHYDIVLTVTSAETVTLPSSDLEHEIALLFRHLHRSTQPNTIPTVQNQR
ncbi:ribonuclease P protein component [Candidatus Saccharibacteria bacterium]|nr:ribonuclease P protein component [Candidatus Saccharibacteria bacterium]